MPRQTSGSSPCSDTFLLLFNPDANDPQEIRDYFAARSIEAVTPAEIRTVVIDKIRDVGTPA